MSRIGKVPVSTEGVEVTYSNDVITMKSSKGELSLEVPVKNVTLDVADSDITVNPVDDEKLSRALHGTIRSRLQNMVDGLTKGFSKKLEFNGVGYNVAVAGKSVKMNLGFSHPVEEIIPEGITCEAEGNTLTVSGFDKVLVGEFAAQVRNWRRPEPYLGKGIKYSDEHIVRKQGKKLGA